MSRVAVVTGGTRGIGAAISSGLAKPARDHGQAEADGERGEDTGTGRRHVIAMQVVHIGKEANKWEERYFLGDDEEAEIEYGVEESGSMLDAKIAAICEEIGERATARKIGISRTSLRRALKYGAGRMFKSPRARFARTT